jgi:hypothetical protein
MGDIYRVIYRSPPLNPAFHYQDGACRLDLRRRWSPRLCNESFVFRKRLGPVLCSSPHRILNCFGQRMSGLLKASDWLHLITHVLSSSNLCSDRINYGFPPAIIVTLSPPRQPRALDGSLHFSVLWSPYSHPHYRGIATEMLYLVIPPRPAAPTHLPTS